MAKRLTCDHPGCGVQLILARNALGKRLPALDAFPDPLGTVAARREASGAWIGHFLAKGEEPDASLAEHRYAVHHCTGSDHKAQRDQVRTAQADLARAKRNRRGTRPGKPVTGYVRQPPVLPGMGGE
jgi:hypothetical protein